MLTKSTFFMMRRSSRRLYAPTPLGTFRELTTLNKNPSTPHAQVPTAKFLELTISQNDQTMKKLVHPLFLRERDTNPLLSQQPTGQRYFEPTDFIECSLSSASLSPAGELAVTFSDEHTTTFASPDMLATEVLDPTFPHTMPALTVWGTSDMPMDKLYFDYSSPDFDMHKLLSQVASHGACVIKNTPAKEETLGNFVKTFGLARNTNWGFYFSVKSVGTDYSMSDEEGISVQDVAYSNKRLDLHVDNPYRDPYPQYQLLHCVRAAPEDKGGESIIADGFCAAEILRRDYPEYFNILATTKVRVQYKDDDVEQIRFVSVLQTDPLTGDPSDPSTQKMIKIASSARLDYSPSLTPADAQLFYQARKEWLRAIHSPEVALSWRLNDGDMLIVDNGRVMHGREAFENTANTSRHLEGCYMDRDSLFSKFLMLGRESVEPSARLLGVEIVEAPIREEVVKRSLDNRAKVKFTSLAEASKEDMDLMGPLYAEYSSPAHLAKRSLGLLKAQKGQHAELGAKVDLYEHGVQTATRAYRDGASDEMVACALLHDIGELLSPSNHGDVAAGILRPYISRAMWWSLCNHELFQGYYYYDHVGLDKNARDKYLDGEDGGHNGPAPEGGWEMCAEFCRKYDAPSFDPEYKSMELEEFMPVLERVFAREAFWDDEENLKKGAVVGGGREQEEKTA